MNGRRLSFLFVVLLILPLFSFKGQEIISSSADDDALAAGVGRDVLFLVGGAAAAGLIVVTTSGSTTVKLDAVTSAGNAVSFTSAAQGRGAVVAERAGGTW